MIGVKGVYTRIANKILEQLARQVLSPDEWRVLMIIFRKTYGWGKTHDSISHGQFSVMTGIPRKHVPRVINRLLSRNLIGRVSPVQRTGVLQAGDNKRKRSRLNIKPNTRPRLNTKKERIKGLKG